MKVLVIVKVWRKAHNTDIDNKIGGFKDGCDSLGC
jgi:hypothetical protein